MHGQEHDDHTKGKPAASNKHNIVEQEGIKQETAINFKVDMLQLHCC